MRGLAKADEPLVSFHLHEQRGLCRHRIVCVINNFVQLHLYGNRADICDTHEIKPFFSTRVRCANFGTNAAEILSSTKDNISSNTDVRYFCNAIHKVIHRFCGYYRACISVRGLSHDARQRAKNVGHRRQFLNRIQNKFESVWGRECCALSFRQKARPLCQQPKRSLLCVVESDAMTLVTGSAPILCFLNCGSKMLSSFTLFVLFPIQRTPTCAMSANLYTGIPFKPLAYVPCSFLSICGDFLNAEIRSQPALLVY
jgi:hypothetical protein